MREEETEFALVMHSASVTERKQQFKYCPFSTKPPNDDADAKTIYIKDPQ